MFWVFTLSYLPSRAVSVWVYMVVHSMPFVHPLTRPEFWLPFTMPSDCCDQTPTNPLFISLAVLSSGVVQCTWPRFHSACEVEIWKSQLSVRTGVRRERWLHCDKIPFCPVEWLYLIRYFVLALNDDSWKAFRALRCRLRGVLLWLMKMHLPLTFI